MGKSETKEAFLIKKDYRTVIQRWKAEQKAELLDAIFTYQTTGEYQTKSERVEDMMVALIEYRDKQNKKYDEICERNKAIAIEREAKKREKTRNNTNVHERTRTATNSTDKDIDIDIDKDVVVVVNNTKVYTRAATPDEEPPQQLPELYPDNINQIVTAWNAQKCTKNIADIPLMRQRYNYTRECIRGDLEQFLKTIGSLDSQAYFSDQYGRNKPVTYDWFVNPNNYQKVIEGNYANAYKKEEPKNGSFWDS